MSAGEERPQTGEERPETGPAPETGEERPETGPAPEGAVPGLGGGSALAPDEVFSGRGGEPGEGDDGERRESVEQPGKVMRIGTMVRQLLEEVRQAPMDEAGRARLKEIYEQSVRELATGLSGDLSEELDRMTFPFEEGIPSEAELRVAQAQLVGWLEGLFHGIQATLVAQQMAARAQLDQMRHQELPSGSENPPRSGTYL